MTQSPSDVDGPGYRLSTKGFGWFLPECWVKHMQQPVGWSCALLQFSVNRLPTSNCFRHYLHGGRPVQGSRVPAGNRWWMKVHMQHHLA